MGTVKTTNPVSLSDVYEALGGSSNTKENVKISDYYRGGDYVPSVLSANAGVPTSGNISINDLKGASNRPSVDEIVSYMKDSTPEHRNMYISAKFDIAHGTGDWVSLNDTSLGYWGNSATHRNRSSITGTYTKTYPDKNNLPAPFYSQYITPFIFQVNTSSAAGESSCEISLDGGSYNNINRLSWYGSNWARLGLFESIDLGEEGIAGRNISYRPTITKNTNNYHTGSMFVAAPGKWNLVSNYNAWDYTGSKDRSGIGTVGLYGIRKDDFVVVIWCQRNYDSSNGIFNNQFSGNINTIWRTNTYWYSRGGICLGIATGSNINFSYTWNGNQQCVGYCGVYRLGDT